MVGLATNTFDIEHPKYTAAKYERSVDAIAPYVPGAIQVKSRCRSGHEGASPPTVKMMPVFPVDPNNQEALQIWKEELHERRTQSTQIEAESNKRAYALVMGTVLPYLISKIRGSTNYGTMNASTGRSGVVVTGPRILLRLWGRTAEHLDP